MSVKAITFVSGPFGVEVTSDDDVCLTLEGAEYILGIGEAYALGALLKAKALEAEENWLGSK